MKQTCLILFFLANLYCSTSLSQGDTISFYATIINEDFEPLSFSNIGIKNNPKISTVADLNGKFELKCLETDTLIIRHVGYKKTSIPVLLLITNEKFNQYRNIILFNEYQELNEATVTAKKRKIKHRNYGSNSTGRGFALGVDSKDLGYEFGVKINIPTKGNKKLERFNCSISESSVDSVKFRLNIYDYEEKDSSINLLNNNIILVSSLKREVLSIDLRNENIYVKDDILVTLEVIECFGDGIIDFSTSTLYGGTYFRTGKESPWEKFPVIGLAFNIDVKRF